VSFENKPASKQRQFPWCCAVIQAGVGYSEGLVVASFRAGTGSGTAGLSSAINNQGTTNEKIIGLYKDITKYNIEERVHCQFTQLNGVI
jgi:hypothetical protein